MNSKNSKLVVTHVVSGDLWAGAESQVYNLCRALATSKEIFVTAIVFNPGILYDKLRELGVPVTLADENKLGSIAICRTIAGHCKVHESKIVHTHGFKENVLGIIGKELARVPFSVRTVHGNPETPFALTHCHKWMLKQFDALLGRLRQQAVVAVSTQLEEKLRKIFPGKVTKIFNFIDVEDLRLHWQTPSKSCNSIPCIGIIGRLVPVKRVDIFIRTIDLLNQRGIPCRGVVIGDGPNEFKLQQLADSLQISDRIDFKGFVAPALSEIRSLDIVAMTSDHEGLPMTLLETLALEIPIVAHNVGGIPEALDIGRCGWLVEDHSPDGYTKAITTVINSWTDRKTKTASGLNHVRKVFGINTNSQEYERLYRAITIKQTSPSKKL